ncbi:MAG: hypothetical protein AAF235_02990 [Planctomycetota bacterium]
MPATAAVLLAVAGAGAQSRSQGNPTDGFRPTPPAQADPAAPGITGGQAWLGEVLSPAQTVDDATALPERTFFANRRGRAERGPAGTMIFVPSRDERAPGERAMLLFPGTVTDQLASVLPSDGRGEITLSGQLFLYHGRNYVLPSGFQRSGQNQQTEEPAAAADPSATDPRPTDRPQSPGSGRFEPDADVEDLIASLREAGGDDNRPSPAPWATGAEPEPFNDDTTSGRSQRERLEAARDAREDERNASASAVVPPDAIAMRRGRVIRNERGAWTFIANNAAGSAEAIADPLASGMVLLPSQMLMRIEAVAQREGDLRSVSVSGRVLVSGSDTYLLPTILRIEPPSDIRAR